MSFSWHQDHFNPQQKVKVTLTQSVFSLFENQKSKSLLFLPILVLHTLHAILNISVKIVYVSSYFDKFGRKWKWRLIIYLVQLLKSESDLTCSRECVVPRILLTESFNPFPMLSASSLLEIMRLVFTIVNHSLWMYPCSRRRWSHAWKSWEKNLGEPVQPRACHRCCCWRRLYHRWLCWWTSWKYLRKSNWKGGWYKSNGTFAMFKAHH